MVDLLYRGVNFEMYERLGAKLCPKIFEPFKLSPKWDEVPWDDSTWNESPENAVIAHQRNQAGYPTSGVSCTPHMGVATNYATHGGHFSVGYIYVLDPSKFEKFGVKSYKVSEIVSKPSVPEDDEIIIVHENFGILPEEIILEVRKIIT